MTFSSSLAVSNPNSPGIEARQQIEKFLGERMVGRKIDAVAFMEELLALATQVGEISCYPVEKRGLRFKLADTEPFEVDLDGNRGKLRMLCARLAVLCQSPPQAFYGGEGTLRRMVKAPLPENENESVLYCVVWKVRWMNTPDKHEFTITVAR